ncbi:hypothetical protein CCO03_07345 [Comamonas serinivorans]|uniref:DUF3016 domain-containing protein n=1 Tax=Comamonas serinivorans TaxID=1082851 RepID=A0A1Y0ELR2_9BURK|nr:DUF3016 domain-containing protein [Comamonas serinivorans]ARU04516.1 hypothetical protein CCO03_07345 [Comamonas serinivorans]
MSIPAPPPHTVPCADAATGRALRTPGRSASAHRRTRRLPGLLLVTSLSLGLLAGCVQEPLSRKPDRAIATDAATLTVTEGPVRVQFEQPLRFDRERNAPAETDRARLAWVTALGEHLAQRAAARLPVGQRLEVRITEVQRAGGFEPWRGPQADVRIVRDIYPPRIALAFKRLAADGQTLQAGHRELRDNAFLARADGYPSDPLRHEKTLLDTWLRQDLPEAPPAR